MFGCVCKSFTTRSEPFITRRESFIGASKSFIGASKSFIGASESFIGASESSIGASEPFIGASESFIGASESFIGACKSFTDASESFIGASESFIGADNLPTPISRLANRGSLAYDDFAHISHKNGGHFPMADYYPQSMDARATWHANWVIQLAALAGKYNIDGAYVAQAQADNDWMQYWVQARHDADNLKQQLTKYFNDIAGNDETLEPPAPIVWQLSGGAPHEAAPGIEFRTRKGACDIKGSMVFAAADGELLGIVSSEDTPASLAALSADFTLRTLANFELEATFKKAGMDALRFEFRHKGGNWMPAGFLITSPGTFAVTPSTPGEAEQIEVRAFLIQKNNVVGNPSDAKAAFIAP